MRIWQKIYFTVLILFLVMLNLGLFFAARFVFSYNLKQEREKVETECYFLCQNLERDFSVLEKNGRYREEIVTKLFEGYKSYYGRRNVQLSLEEANGTEAFIVRSEVAKGGRQIRILAERSLPEPYGEYRICYQKRLVEFEAVWDSLQKTFAGISFVMSVLLCLILYVLMRHILKPLANLNDRVQQIAAGEYVQRIPYKNRNLWERDEITELSKNVNKMSETIQSQIFKLEGENEKKQQLMDNMAHELKTPLTSIYGYAQYLRYAKAGEEEKHEGLDYIMEESMRLSKMSETMLSMRLYEKQEKTVVSVNLGKIALHVEKLLLEQLREKNINLQKNFEIEIVYGEEELLINLFRNLLENAVRASKAGDKIVWNARAGENGQVIELIDYGIGMEEEELARITEAFYRVDKARSRKDGGVGLGLSVAELIVKRMNGKMFFSSAPKEGTKVTIIFTTS